MKKRRPFNVTKLIFASGIIFFALLATATLMVIKDPTKEGTKGLSFAQSIARTANPYKEKEAEYSEKEAKRQYEERQQAILTQKEAEKAQKIREKAEREAFLKANTHASGHTLTYNKKHPKSQELSAREHLGTADDKVQGENYTWREFLTSDQYWENPYYSDSERAKLTHREREYLTFMESPLVEVRPVR